MKLYQTLTILAILFLLAATITTIMQHLNLIGDSSSIYVTSYLLLGSFTFMGSFVALSHTP